MERYWLAVLVVAFLVLSSANGAAFIGPGEEQQCMLDALYMYLYVPTSLLTFVRSFVYYYLFLQERALAPIRTQQVRVINYIC